MIGCGRGKRLRGEERAGENYLFLDANKVECLIVNMVASCDIFGLVLLVGYSTVVEARARS